MNHRNQDLRDRSKEFALRCIRLYAALPKNMVAQVIGKQLLRSGTSVGAHYREAHRSKSNADFVSKIEGGLHELDETAYWLELLDDSKAVSSERLKALRDENDELIAIFVSIAKNVKSKR